jgi:hypothetical protein
MTLLEELCAAEPTQNSVPVTTSTVVTTGTSNEIPE